MKKKISLNSIVKGILNRNKIYGISQYTWEATKKLGRKITSLDISRCFSHLKNEGKISINFINKKPCGLVYNK